MVKKGKTTLNINKQAGNEFVNYVREASALYMPGVSVNIVVFNFRDGKIKVLIMRFADTGYHMLPGGYVGMNEDLDDAALRIFNEWTGLSNIHLEQIYTSGKADRLGDHLVDVLKKTGTSDSYSWLYERKLSICYLTLLHEHEINPGNIEFVSEYIWMDLSDIPPLLFDHNHIIEKALQKTKENLEHMLSVSSLFKKEFTMGELQKLYEAVFQKSFTRTNFQRRMINIGILERIGKHYSGKAHKAPYLYRFKNASES
jgi:8-oxo-dGTP diphosphatase